MRVEQIYTGCLAQGAYYIESNNEVAIIDPLREVDQYLNRAKQSNSIIKYIFETHFHADFVSGHLTLSKQSGAKIIYGPTAETKFESTIAKDGQEFKVGNVIIKAIHTPGHTLESTCYLLKDENGNEHSLFTGDTLFLGDVGRPDLAQENLNITKEELAGKLFDSLRNKIMCLPDNIIIYPAHGAGSACGKNMMSITSDSLLNQKKVNYALSEKLSKKSFIKTLINGLEPPPKYFPSNVKMNREGYSNVDDIIKMNKSLKPEDFLKIANSSNSLILDVRSSNDFEKSHIPRSIFIGLDGSFAPWVGEMVKDVKQKILFICDKGREDETVTRLSRVGFDNTLGYLDGGIDAWIKSGYEIDSVDSIEHIELSNYNNFENDIIDVRKSSEFLSKHLKNAENVSLSSINENLDKFLDNKVKYIHCQAGYRSMIACSILKSRGIHNIINIRGGFKAILNNRNLIFE